MANLPFNVDEVVVEKVKDDKKRLANSKRQYLANRGRDPTMQFKRLSEIAISVQYGYTAQETSQQGVYKYLRITDIVPYYPNFETVPYCAIDNDEAQKYGSSANCRKPFCPAATHPNTAGHFGKPRCRVGTPPLPGCIRRSALQPIIP